MVGITDPVYLLNWIEPRMLWPPGRWWRMRSFQFDRRNRLLQQHIDIRRVAAKLLVLSPQSSNFVAKLVHFHPKLPLLVTAP